MPKIIIREFDKSTAGNTLSTDFSVVVPGYVKVNIDDLSDEERSYIDPTGKGIYEINSQADFDKYVGREVGVEQVAAAPVFIQYGPDANAIASYQSATLTMDQFESEEFKGRVCISEEVYRNETDFGKNGYLLKTWGETTRRFQIVDKVSDLEWEQSIEQVPVEGGEEGETDTVVKYIIKTPVYILANTDEVTKGCNAVSETHIGNQMAFELLGLGYKVLYMPVSKLKSAEEQLGTSEFWEPLKDKTLFRFRYITTGGCYSPAVNSIIAALANYDSNISLAEAEVLGGKSNGRGDVIALCDIDEDRYNLKASDSRAELAAKFKTAAGAISTNKYSAIFAPRVIYSRASEGYTNTRFPASFHYLACAANAFQNYSEWYAVAGYTRGVSSLDIVGTTLPIGSILNNTLAPRATNNYATKSINLIISERGNYYLWGNRTAETLGTGLRFSHFLNIRQLCTSIKQVLYTACRQFQFDPNSDLLWINFKNALRPTLEKMKADQGIMGYKITKINTAEKAVLSARIRIVPIEAVEDFDIEIDLEDSIAGIVATATETEVE